jgi:alpha-galactosidase
VAAFGAFGYELDFGELSPAERRAVKEQIAFYKAHRRTFQYGKLEIIEADRKNRAVWKVTGEDEIFVGFFQSHASACPARDVLRVPGLDPNKEYTVTTVKQYLRIGRFGSLIKHLVPFSVNADGFLVRTVERHFEMTDGREEYICRGDALAEGINLAMQYEGTGYADTLRILGDFGSNIYHIKERS